MKVILITVWSRADKLKACLDSLQKVKDIADYTILIVQQDDFPEVGKVIENVDWTQLVVLKTCGKFKTGVQNITYNRVIGYNKAFFEMSASIVYGMEDDVILGYDSLHFAQMIIEKYENDKNFRGVNLFSGEVFNEKNKFKYGKFRFGISGQSWAINKKIWQSILDTNILNDHKNMGLDGLLEGYIRSGFVVMPYCSRYIDTGWGGTHAPSDSAADYFKNLERSWVGLKEFPVKDYVFDNGIDFNWRKDCLKYRSAENCKYYILYLVDRFRKRTNLQLRNRVKKLFL